MKNNSKKNFLLIVVLILISGFVGYKIASPTSQDKCESKIEQDSIEDANADKEKPIEIIDVDISFENQIYSVAILEDFDDGKNLTVEQYLEVIYSGICNGYINVEINERNEISEQLVKSIIYKIFGVELKDNKSINGMKYENGVYTISIKKSDYIYLIENVKRDSAAGSSYASFDLYKEFASGMEKYMGKYNLVTVQNTITGEGYIKSLKNMKK